MRKKFYQRRIAGFFLAFPISMAVFVLVHCLYLWIAEGNPSFAAERRRNTHSAAS